MTRWYSAAGKPLMMSTSPFSKARRRVLGSGSSCEQDARDLGAPPKYLGFASNSMESSGLYSLMMYGPVPGSVFQHEVALDEVSRLDLGDHVVRAIGMSGCYSRTRHLAWRL